MSFFYRLPETDPLLKDQSDNNIALTSEKVLLEQTDLLNELNRENKVLKKDLNNVVNVYHGADSKATRLGSQNARLVEQLEFAEDRVDELEHHNTDLARRLAESEREFARLKAAGDKDEAQTVGVKRKRGFFEDLVWGNSKPQATAVGEEEGVVVESPRKKPKRPRHREGLSKTPGNDAVVEKEADVEDTVGF